MSEWKQAPLGDLVKIQKGKLSAHADFPMDGYLPVINTETIAGKITVWGEPIGSVLCDENDLLLLWDGERSGLVAIGFRGIVGSTFSKLTVKSDVESNYLYHQLQNKFGWIQQQRTGTGVPHVPKNLNIILNIDFPTSIPEQRKIARILSTVDAVIEKTEAAIAKNKAIKAGMMRDLFTRGIDLATGKLRPSYEEAPELYKQSELGWIPKEWIYTYFSKIIKSTRLGTSMLGGEQQYGIPLLKMGNLTLSGFSFNKLERLNTNDKEKIADFLVKSGDFLFNTRNTLDLVGKSCVWKNELPYAAFNSNIMRIKFIDSIDNYFMGYFFENSIGWKEFKRIAMGTTSVAAIYNRDFENCRIIIPKSHDEQVSISKKLLSIDKLANKENGNLNKLNNIKQALMSDLLTGKVRVKYEEEKEEAF